MNDFHNPQSVSFVFNFSQDVIYKQLHGNQETTIIMWLMMSTRQFCHVSKNIFS